MCVAQQQSNIVDVLHGVVDLIPYEIEKGNVRSRDEAVRTSFIGGSLESP